MHVKIMKFHIFQHPFGREKTNKMCFFCSKEYVNSSSLPPSKLNLKMGCPIILLWNLSLLVGLCNWA